MPYRINPLLRDAAALVVLALNIAVLIVWLG